MLAVGDRVRVSKHVQKRRNRGRVSYMGPLDEVPGYWLGVTLDEPVGKNMGNGYFKCEPGHGVFVEPQDVVQLELAGDVQGGRPPAFLEVASPHGPRECTGEYILVPYRDLSGLPMWRKSGADAEVWLRSAGRGHWVVGPVHVGPDGLDASAPAGIVQRVLHEGAFPSRSAAPWSRLDGGVLVEDEDILVIEIAGIQPLLKSLEARWLREGEEARRLKAASEKMRNEAASLRQRLEELDAESSAMEQAALDQEAEEASQLAAQESRARELQSLRDQVARARGEADEQAQRLRSAREERGQLEEERRRFQLELEEGRRRLQLQEADDVWRAESQARAQEVARKLEAERKAEVQSKTEAKRKVEVQHKAEDLAPVYQGKFSHPLFGGGEMDIVVRVEVDQASSRGSCTAEGQTWKISIDRSGSAVTLREVNGPTVMEGNIQSRAGDIVGEVVQSGARGGTFKLVPKQETRNEVPGGGATLFERLVQALGRKSGTPGAAEIQQFLGENSPEVANALSRFGPSGEFRNGEPLPASCFNDFYKWTMLPVVVAAERASGGVRCTFSVNIRDVEYRNQLYGSAVGNASGDLFEDVKSGLRGLTKRMFDRALFEQCARDYQLPNWGTDTIDDVCGPVHAPRALVQEFRADASCSTPVAPKSPGSVLVQVFVARDEKLKQDRVYIEATGPWHKVTWLETSMMQVVYDCLLRDRMRQRYRISKSSLGSWDDSAWFADWLAEAMCRCARSVKVSQESGMKGALFTGRRTGGLALMILQGLYAQQAFRSPDGAPMLLGSSSVTSCYLSLAAGVAPEHVPKCAGTHAHELQMTLAAILGDLDDQCGMPLSQVVSHMLYFYRSRPQGDVREAARKGLMPMLTDTLGSRAFMRTAAKLRVPFGVHNGEPLLSIIGAARQDSGTLEAYRDLMSEFGYTGALMASEIETGNDISKASSIGFKLFGAGGFMGDSEKAWDCTKTSISMAVKVLRVYVGGSGVASAFPPVKTGEVGTDGRIKEEKFEIDGTLPREKFEQSRQRAQVLCEAAPKVSDRELQVLFEGALRKFLPDAFLTSEANDVTTDNCQSATATRRAAVKQLLVDSLESGRLEGAVALVDEGDTASAAATAARAARGATAAAGGAALGEPSAAARAWWASSSRGGAPPDAGGGFRMPVTLPAAAPLAAMSAISVYGPELRSIGAGHPLLFI